MTWRSDTNWKKEKKDRKLYFGNSKEEEREDKELIIKLDKWLK